MTTKRTETTAVSENEPSAPEIEAGKIPSDAPSDINKSDTPNDIPLDVTSASNNTSSSDNSFNWTKFQSALDAQAEHLSSKISSHNTKEPHESNPTPSASDDAPPKRVGGGPKLSKRERVKSWWFR